MNWKRDRLAGVATDGVLVGTLVVLVVLADRFRLSLAAGGTVLPGWLELMIAAAAVAAPVALYAPVERLLYGMFKGLLRPRLARLHWRAEELFRTSHDLFQLDRLLDHFGDGLREMGGNIRIGFFLSDDEEETYRMERAYGFNDPMVTELSFRPEDPLAERLRGASDPLQLPIRPDQMPDATNNFRTVVGGRSRGLLVPLHTATALTGAVVIQPADGVGLDHMFANVAVRLLDNSSVLIEDARLYTLARRESLQKDLLFEVGRSISGTLHLDKLLELILDALEKVVGYDAAAIFTVDSGTGQIWRQIVRGYDGESVDNLHLKIGRGLVGRAAESCEAILVRDVREETHYVNARSRTRSELNFPVAVEGEVMAVISLASDDVAAYGSDDLKLTQVFGAQAAVAIQNARLYEEARQMRRLEQELELAGEIQSALLPRHPPEVEGLQVATHIEPTRSIGGDLYDLVPLGECRLGVAIGDISGKGAPAAILMASLYASFRSVTRSLLTLPELMARLNNLLSENVAPGRYATFFYAIIDTEKRELRYSNAGHFPPLLLRAGEEPRLLAEGGMVLGYIRDTAFDEGIVELQPGDLIILYTDGLVEAQNDEGDMFGEERVAEIAATLLGRTAKEVLDGLRGSVSSHCKSAALGDDLTLVVVRVD
jgi:sigma-B regulation protein RsbU (phosphoserine phosphatase)